MTFSCLYFQTETLTPADLLALLREVVTGAGYTPFNPFGGLPTKHYAEQVRLFVCPRQGDSIRAIGYVQDALLPAIAARHPFTLLSLRGDSPRFEAWDASGRSDVTLVAAGTSVAQTAAQPDDIFSVLPDDVRRMNPDAGQAKKMFSRMSKTLLGKSGGEDQREAAMSLLTSRDPDAPDWNSEAGQRLRACTSAFGLPDPHTPDFDALRNAYALHERKRRRPNASSLPGDAESMAALPDALEYLPLYAGKG